MGDEIDTSPMSDCSSVVYVLEGETWQKWIPSKSCLTIPSTTASESDEVSDAASSTELSSALTDVTPRSASDVEPSYGVCHLSCPHALSEQSATTQEQAKRSRRRVAELPCTPPTGTPERAYKQTRPSVFREDVPSFANVNAFVVPGAWPVSLMCAGQWCLPVAPSCVVAPAFQPSHRSATSGTDNLEDQRTTLMLRNLPNNYSRDLVIALLNEHGFFGKYDFLYFPVDFQTGCGLGFAFVNCVTHADACLVKEALNGFHKWSIPSSKCCAVGWSGNDQQGLAANTDRYRNSSVMHKSVPDSNKPIIFKNGVRSKFPCSTKKLWPPSSQYGSRVKQCGTSQR